MKFVCIVISGIVVIYVVFGIWGWISDLDKKYQTKIRNIQNQFYDQRNNFDANLFGFFSSNYGSYQNTYLSLINTVSNMQLTNRKLKEASRNNDYSSTIEQYSHLASEFDDFGKKANQLPYTYMMDVMNYGKIQKNYWNSICCLNKSTVDTIIKNCEQNISFRQYLKIFAIDIDMILRCVWFYAIHKPYLAESFKKAVSIFNRLVEKPHIDVIIAELYAMKQVGGEDVLHEHIRNILKASYTTEELTLIASSLMWLNAYQAESMILQHMLSTGMQMSAKTQERLHSLTNGGGKAPNSFNISSNESYIYFDVSALTWKDDEYIGLFENLAFQEKKLSYSLAVRDENKEFFITPGIHVPRISDILKKLYSVFSEEYGNAVIANLKDCIALSGSGEEHIEGILVESNECKQMGILVHIACIGKKLNIKFYTLFMPNEIKLIDQKQQALSLYKKLSPSVTMWESSIKDTVLMAVQQLLNFVSQSNFAGENAPIDDNSPIF